jgi:hypothetical protein
MRARAGFYGAEKQGDFRKSSGICMWDWVGWPVSLQQVGARGTAANLAAHGRELPQARVSGILEPNHSPAGRLRYRRRTHEATPVHV